MSKKDPAFLFYSKDWLEGTAEMMANEKGVYIDLMAHQHQKGDLPVDILRLAKLVGMGIDEFTPIWQTVKEKFITDGNRMFNEKLSEVMSERSDKGRKNKIIGIFSGLLRKADLNKKDYNLVRKDFNVSEFNNIDSERLNERISEWFDNRLKSIANENEDAKEDSIGGEGEKKEIPTEKEFLEYCKTFLLEKYPGYEFSLKAKYEAWVGDGWKDGNDSKIKNWKTKIKNTIQYLKPMYSNGSGGNELPAKKTNWDGK